MTLILGNKVLAKIIETDEKKGSLYLPEKKKTCEAIVREVGTECTNLKKNDRFIFDKYDGIEIKLDNETLVLFNVKDILAIIEQ